MKTILIINDGSTAVEPAAKLALQIAKSIRASILVAQTYCHTQAHSPKVLAGEGMLKATSLEKDNLYLLLEKLNDEQPGFRSEITTTQLSEPNTGQLTALTIGRDCCLVVRGCGKMPAHLTAPDLQSLLNKLRCPLLLVPEHWAVTPLRRITYMADLRYCRLNIMHYLAYLAKPIQANVSLAHLSAEGLAPIEENYGRDLFAGIAGLIQDCRLTFNNIRETDIQRAVDVIINGLHNDLLVLINHRYHFKEIIGERLTDQLPEGITIPLLLFPI